MSTTRADIHRPSTVVPAEYRELFSYAHATTVDGWPVPGINISLLCAQRMGQPFWAASDEGPREVTAEPIRDDDGKPYPMASCHKGGACDICGAWHVYGSVFVHEPTGECIAIGWQCAENMRLVADAGAQDTLRAKRKAMRLAIAGKIKRRFALRAFVGTADPELLRALRTDHYIVKSIRSNLIKFGSLSEKQEALVLKLAREAAEPKQEERLVPAPISSGRQTIVGVVVSCKIHESVYGDSLKMTVKVTNSDGGTWLAWGSCPSGISSGIELGDSGLRGCRVRFDAQLVAGRDAHFALFKRPTKASVVGLGDDQRQHLDRLRADLAEFADDTSDWAKRQRETVARMDLLAR